MNAKFTTSTGLLQNTIVINTLMSFQRVDILKIRIVFVKYSDKNTFQCSSTYTAGNFPSPLFLLSECPRPAPAPPPSAVRPPVPKFSIL